MTSTFLSRGRRGTNSHLPSFCVAGVALMVLGGALGPGFGACDARGAAPLCVAGVAQPDIHLPFTWQAWYKLTSTVVLRGRRGTYGTGWRPWAGIWRLWRPGRRATLRGRRGTTWHPPSFHVAGVVQTHIYRRFAWQAWHLWYWVAPLGRDLAPVTPGSPRHFAWQAWHNLTSTFVSCGRRGTNSHLPSFCVAGVALMVLGGALGPGFGACDAWGAAPLCVAGVALGDIHLPFTWQEWHKLTSTVVLRGRRGTYGTGWRPWAGIWRLWRPGRRATLCGRRGTWWHPQVVLRGRRLTHGTWWHTPWFHVAGGVAQSHIHDAISWSWLYARYDYQPQGLQKEFAKFCGFARKSAEHYFGQRKYGEHTIALIAEPGGTRRKRSNLLTDNLLTNNLPYIPTYMTYIHTYLPTYIHTFIPTILPSRSFTTSFVFPSFPVPAKTIEAHFRKKLTCGVIRSFNFNVFLHSSIL